MKILIIQTAFIGDVILAAPLIDAAAKRYPSAEIKFLTIPYSAPVLRNHPGLAEVIVFQKRGGKGFAGTVAIARRLKRERFDLALVPHRSLRSAVLAFAAGISQRIGFNRSAGRALLTRRVKYRKDWHEVKRNLSLLGMEDEAKDFPPRIYPGAEEVSRVEAFLDKKGGCAPFIAVAPGSIWETKRWLAEYYHELLILMKTRGMPGAVLVGSASERRLCEEIAAGLEGFAVVAAGEFDPLRSAALLSKAALTVSNDSAAGHIAAAVGTKVISIFGPTVPEFGFAPFGEGQKVVQHPDLYCRPCRIHGSRKCPEQHFRCMLELTPETVLREIEAALG